ncbi:Efflux transporter, RND family, MFP subunit (fragment) [Hyella patelloides LEGE 07179]|uniref:Efflux transporter, RND family, MFP subunit n=1 Tax=Hyella patelloides LEGE 07179 TaxID=945734 RepID=A0A563VW84_9CYAN
MSEQKTFQSKSIVTFRHISAKAIAITLLSLGVSSCGGGQEQANLPQAIAVQLKTLESATVIDSSEYVGTLQARDRVSLAPRIEGRILEIFVSQGDRVSRGDPIASFEPTQEQENVNAATQSVNVERARLGQTQAELSTAEANRAAAAAQVESARADLQELEAEVELAQINIERTKMLVEGGAVAQQDLDDDNRDLKSSLAQRNSRKETLNAAIESLQAAERQVEQSRANIDSQNAIIRRTEAELGSISQNLAFNTINAPIDGIVGSFDDNKVGDYVSVGEELTTITNNQSFDLNINIPVEYRDRAQNRTVSRNY